MIFRRSKEKVSGGVNKMDRLITGLVVGGAIASIFGLSKKKKEGIASKVGGVGKTVFLTGLGIFGKTLAKGVSLFSKKK